jgi:hypothetical protein
VRVPVTCFLSLSLLILAFSSFSPFPHLLFLYFSYLSSLLSLCLHPGTPILIITNDLHQHPQPLAHWAVMCLSFHITELLYTLFFLFFFSMLPLRFPSPH